MVARKDGLPGQVAAPCECGMEERAGKVMERARIPKRYEHCDFESYSTDLTDGKTWTAQHEQVFKAREIRDARVRAGIILRRKKDCCLLGRRAWGKRIWRWRR